MSLSLASTKLWVSTCFLSVAFCWCLHGASPVVRERPRGDPYRLRVRGETPTRVVGGRDGIVITSLTKKERAWVDRIGERISRGGEGGGGSVSDLVLLQTYFLDTACGISPGCDEACNVVVMRWTVESPNPGGTDIFLDDVLQGTVPEDADGVNLRGISAGEHTLRIAAKDGGTSSEAPITVLDTQPFADPIVSCEEGSVDAEGTCQIVVTIDNPGAVPTFYLAYVDGSFHSQVDGGATETRIGAMAPGEHCVDLVGFYADDDGAYSGCFVQGCCLLTCEGAACNPPFDLSVCQVAYRPEDHMHNSVLARWKNGEAMYANGIRALLDGGEVGNLTGDLESAVFNMVLPGPHTFAVQGDCGDDGRSTTAEASLGVLTATPHTRPVEGAISCEWTEDDGGTVTATWTNADPSDSIDVFVYDGFDYFYVDSIDGSLQMVAVSPIDSTDTILLQFFTGREGGCYGSNLLGCGEDRPGFVRGDVDASGAINITDAISLLNYLFLGSAAPSCMDAADSDNSDGATPNITDAIYLLSWLFQGGPAPAMPSPSTATYEIEDCGPDPTPDDDMDCVSFPSCFE